jgi:hypothetical protein
MGGRQHQKQKNGNNNNNNNKDRYSLVAINERASMPVMKDVRPPRGLRFKRSESVPISQFSRLLVVDSLSEGEEEDDDVYSFSEDEESEAEQDNQVLEDSEGETDETKEDDECNQVEYSVHTTMKYDGEQPKREIKCCSQRVRVSPPAKLRRSRSDSALSRIRVRFAMCSVLRLPSSMRSHRLTPTASVHL